MQKELFLEIVGHHEKRLYAWYCIILRPIETRHGKGVGVMLRDGQGINFEL